MTYVIIGGILILGLIVYLTGSANKSRSAENQIIHSQKTPEPKVHHLKENNYEKLRSMAFNVTPEQLGLTVSIEKTEVYGVIMDWEMGGAVATIVSFKSGDASMYISTGGGVIGGGQQQNVNAAAKQLIHIAQSYVDKADKSDNTSLPQTDNIKFYFLTNDGLYVGKEIMTNLENNSSKWFGLFEEVNKVLTELRRTTGNH